MDDLEKKGLTRRDFLRASSTAAIAGALFGTGLGDPRAAIAQAVEKKTRVVLVRDPGVLDEAGNIEPEALERMLDEAVTALLGENDPAAAWKRIVKPADIVGIKTNQWGHLPTPKALESAIEKRVIGAGVLEKNISIRDQGLLDDPIFVKSTALINVRPLRTHHWSGVGSLLKNYIMFSRTPSDYHADSCADLAKLWTLPEVAGKTRLNILVVLTPLFHGIGAHHFNPEYTWPYRGLLVGLDPVAVDSTGVRLLVAKRKEYFKEDRPINPPPKSVYMADTRHHLGTADPEKIELVKLGWKEGALI
jgi:hypothetical protein